MAAFSNGYEWDCWSSKWCDTCINDINQACPIVSYAIMGGQPTEWLPNVENSLYDKYTCTKYKEIE